MVGAAFKTCREFSIFLPWVIYGFNRKYSEKTLTKMGHKRIDMDLPILDILSLAQADGQLPSLMQACVREQ